MNYAKRFMTALILLFVLSNLCFCTVAEARAPQAGPTVKGVVEDQSGAIVPAANLTLVNQTSGRWRRVFSDGEGRFVFSDLELGSYLLKAEADNSEGARMESAQMNVEVSRGKPLDLKVRLRISVHEEVSVTTASADPLAPESNPDALPLSIELLRGLPTESENIQSLIGNFSSPAAGGTEGLSLVVDGLESDQMDDLPASAIRTVTIDRNPYSAEFRRPGKARVEITTRGGSQKRYHGGLALFTRDSAFDARNAFASVKPNLRRKLIEGSLSGPLYFKGGTFFVSGQGLLNRKEAIVNAKTLTGPVVANVPTNQNRVGILARLDFHMSPLHSFTASYGFEKNDETNGGVGGFLLPEQAYPTVQKDHKFQFTDQAVLSASFLNTVRAIVRHENSAAGATPIGPEFAVNGAFTGGASQVSTLKRRTLVEIQDTALYSRRYHIFRFGGAYRTRGIDVTDESNFGGTFDFSDLDHFAAGQPYAFLINKGTPGVSLRLHDADGFFQDEFKVMTNLSLILGLRYDWQSSLLQHNRFAPRAGFAYAPGGRKMVFRGGMGVFYERLPESAVERSSLFDGLRLRQLVIVNPRFPDPFVAAGPASIPPSLVTLDSRLSTPYLVQGSLSVEQELWKGAHLTIAGEALRGKHFFRSRNINAPLPQTGTLPDLRFRNIDQIESTASMNSNAVSVTFSGRVARHFNAVVQYTFSHTTNDTSGIFSLPANNYDLRPERGRADFDRRHRFTLAGIVNLPAGFRVGVLANVGSGIPYDITTGFDNNLDTVANDRPPGVTRNSGQGPGVADLDLRLVKLFRLPRPANRDRVSRNFEISVDFFNSLNHKNSVNFVGVMSSPFFGQANSALPGRTIQFSARYRF